MMAPDITGYRSRRLRNICLYVTTGTENFDAQPIADALMEAFRPIVQRLPEIIEQLKPLMEQFKKSSTPKYRPPMNPRTAPALFAHGVVAGRSAVAPYARSAC